ATDKDARFIPIPIIAGGGNDEEEEEEENKQSETEESAPAEKGEETDEKAASDKEATDKDARFIPIPIVAGGGDDEEEEKEEAEQQEKAEPKTMADALSSMANDGREDEMSTVLVGKDGRRVQIKCRQSFRARMICACDESKDYYNDLKNYLLSYEGVSAADSLNYESFSGGRRQLAKLNITGKTVILFLALDPAKLEGSKYKYDNVGDRKRYEKTPVKVKVRSERSFKWAKELIDMTMAEEGRPFVALREEQHVPRESLSRSELIRQGLIQVDARDMENGQKVDEATVVRMIEEGAVPEGSRSAQRDGEQMPNAGMVAVGVAAAVAVASVAGDGEEESLESAAEESGLDESFTLADMPMMANVSLAPEEEYIPHLEAVTAEEAEELVENVVAEHHIEHHVEPDAPRAKGKRSRGKPAVLNIDALDQTYAPGESITLARLKADGLVPKNARSLKILAHGSLTKPLTVEANRFSLTAVKMILLTGGTPVQLD
ncbi:MAG: uL15 family ribosomal protein, partial [Clostridia bacterium]|nr:uL15 family ribosomal protein [Clostridia bacterium]